MEPFCDCQRVQATFCAAIFPGEIRNTNHSYPVNIFPYDCKYFAFSSLRVKTSVFDFNFPPGLCHALSAQRRKGMTYVLRTIGFLATHGTSTTTRIRKMRRTLQRQSTSQAVPLLRSVPRRGIRAADLPRIAPRHRDVSAGNL